jgi:hypothetical protein
VLKQSHSQNSGKGCCTQQHGCAPSRAAALAARQHHRCDGESFWNLVQKDGQKNNPSQPVGDEEARSNRNPIEKRVDGQTEQNRISLVGVNKLIFMGFLSEMEVWSDGVLEKMDYQVAHQNQKRCTLTAQFQGCGKNFDDGCGQHESRA